MSPVARQPIALLFVVPFLLAVACLSADLCTSPDDASCIAPASGTSLLMKKVQKSKIALKFAEDTGSNGPPPAGLMQQVEGAVAMKTTRRVTEMMLQEKRHDRGSFESEAEFGERQVSLSIEAEGSEFSHRSGSTFPVKMTVKNNGASSYVMMLLESPFEDEIMDNIFVTDPRTSEFTGRVVERWGIGPNRANSVLLAAGGSFSKTVDLNKYLRFKNAGKYNLSLEYDFIIFETAYTSLDDALHTLRDETEETAVQAEMKSNVIEVNVVDAAQLSLQETHTEATPGTLGFRNCDWNQKQTITAATEIAKEMTDAASYYLDNQDEDDDWSEWFGTVQPVFQASVTAGIKEVDNVLNNLGFIAECGCQEAGTYAYVYPTDTERKVYLCPVFWGASSSKARDSQPGTIIHEISHFNAVMGTADHAYGTDALRGLAANNPAQARLNADSVEGYTEDGDLSLYPRPTGPTPPPPAWEEPPCKDSTTYHDPQWIDGCSGWKGAACSGYWFSTELESNCPLSCNKCSA